MQSWLEGRIWVGKGAQATGMTASLRIQASKADSNTCEGFTRSGLKLESVHQESPRSDIFRKGYQANSEPETTSEAFYLGCGEKELDCCSVVKVLFSGESKFCISFGNQGPRVWRKSGEAQNPCCLKSSGKFPQSVMIWAAKSSAGVGSTVFSEVPQSTQPSTRKFLEHFMLPSADKLYGDADSFSSRTWHLPTLQRYSKGWFNDHGVTVLDWPANLPDLKPIENLWGIVKRRWETPDPTLQMSWRPLSKKPGLPYHLSSATNWSPPCHAEFRQ